jgi:PAS domain S-box-containing protein
MEMHGHYDPFLVAVSVGVATFASFTALNLTGRLAVADKAARHWWLAAAALALGGGIWSMHFVGMLAFSMDAPIFYDVRMTTTSLLLPVAATWLGLSAACRFGVRWRPVLAGGVIVGLAVVIMHYTGMAAMQMPGVTIAYSAPIVGLSIAIAIAAATAALWLAFRTERSWQRLAAALMGAAISGMHYTGMAAAHFQMDGTTTIPSGLQALQPGGIAVAVVFATVTLLFLAWMTAWFDRKLATLTAHEAEVLRKSEERYRSLIENASDIIAIIDRQGTFVYESSSASNVLGYTTAELIGRTLFDLAPEDRAGDIAQLLQKVLDHPSEPESAEVPLLHSVGTWRDFEVVAKNLSGDPTIGGIVVNMRDITVRKQLMAQLEALSDTDLLTGVLNRRGLSWRPGNHGCGRDASLQWLCWTSTTSGGER